MSLAKSKFEAVARGFKQALVLIPGWATDFRIFSSLKLEYDYLLVKKLVISSFVRDLADFLDKNKIPGVSLFGFSLGGFLAREFTLVFPERVRELILVGIRKRYPPEQLALAWNKMIKNKRAFLYRSYLDSFSESDSQGREWFKKNILRRYLEELDLKSLRAGLDYLGRARFSPCSGLKVEKVRIFHGKCDTVAPIVEARSIARRIKGAEFIALDNLGHLPFLNSAFKKNFYGQKSID